MKYVPPIVLLLEKSDGSPVIYLHTGSVSVAWAYSHECFCPYINLVKLYLVRLKPLRKAEAEHLGFHRADLLFFLSPVCKRIYIYNKPHIYIYIQTTDLHCGLFELTHFSSKPFIGRRHTHTKK